jgi:hypothetical protein
MAVSLVFMPILTFRDVNDNPIPFARVWSYQAGTTTPLALYVDPAGATPLSNPAITDASGRLVAYATVGTAYKLDVFDSANVHVPGWPIDSYIVQPAGTPGQIAGFSSLADMRLTLDPGEVGTEVIASDLNAILQELKFVLKERGRVNQWYESYTNCTVSCLQWIGDLPATIPNLYPPTGTTTQAYSFPIPDGWRGQTNMTWVFFRKSTSGVGTSIMSYTMNRERSGQAAANIVSNTAINFVPGSGNVQQASATIPGAGLLAGDVVSISLQRLGDDPSDTDAGNIIVMSTYVVYTGLAGT